MRLDAAAPADLTSVLERNSPDEMGLSFRAPEAGFVQFIEAWDVGWRAQLNGKSVPILKSNEFLMAVPVAAGDNTIRLFFRTPGKFPGLLISLLGVLWSICFSRVQPQSNAKPRDEPNHAQPQEKSDPTIGRHHALADSLFVIQRHLDEPRLVRYALQCQLRAKMRSADREPR